MKTLSPIVTLLALLFTLSWAQDDDIVDQSNAKASCNNGPSGIALYKAERTCIESPLFDGKRCFFTYIPDCAGKDSPLVFDLHGFGSCPSDLSFYSGWQPLAKANCFVVVWPIGTLDATIADTTCWGFPGGALTLDKSKFASPCCCFKDDAPVVTTEPEFLRQAAATAIQDIPEKTSQKVTINAKRIYMAGHSNGCMASISMATLHSDMVAAVGCHAGRATTLFPDAYNPTPMAFVHGTSDPTVRYDGRNFQLSAQEYLSLISDENGCTASNETRRESYLGTTNNVTEFRSSNCTNDADVALYAIDNVGHLPYYIASQVLQLVEEGTSPVEFDTTQLMWDFVKGYSLDVEPDLKVVPYTMEPSRTPSTMPTAAPSASVRTQVGRLVTLVMALVAVQMSSAA